jgi:hypothetical protein
MRKFVVLASAAAAAAITAVVVGALGASAAPAPGQGAGEQADSVRFVLNFGDPENPKIGDVVYCGVAEKAEPYVLDVAASNPSVLVDPDDPESGKSPSHEGAGWLSVVLQGNSPVDIGTNGERGIEFNVPLNDSFSFGLTLGGVPNVDQLVQISSWPLGDADGSGAGFRGFATVRAQRGAVDPFEGDGRSDNYCVSIGVPGGEPGEFLEGAISTTLPVRDGWVLDGDGSDGGVLVGFPH